jgi:Skp family chaperone for outer membrane proteins
MKNNMKQYSIIVGIAIILTVLILYTMSGCKQNSANATTEISSASLRIGYIDSDRLATQAEFPELTSFFEKKEKERARIRSLMTAKKHLTEAEKESIRKATKEFVKSEDALIKDFVETMRVCSKKVAEEKKLDMVLNNKSAARIVEYGGIDITEDVRAKILEMRKTDKKDDKTKSSSTPANK